MAEITRSEAAQTVNVVTYSLTGADGVTFTASVTGDTVQVTSDDPQANANVILAVSSIPTLLALVASVQVNAVAATTPSSSDQSTDPASDPTTDQSSTPSTDPAPTA